MKRVFDKSVWVVALSAGIALSSASFVFCPTARAGNSAPVPPLAMHTPTDASKTAMALDTDDDGNELLEHWSDPRYSAEERLQLAGILVIFAVAGTVRTARRRALQRSCFHG